MLNPPAAHALLGDVNGDGVVNLLDAQVLSNYLIGAGPLPYPQNADVNGDGRINTADALLILQVAEGLRTNFASQIPQVLAVLPSSGSVNALLSSNISVFFSAPISSASLVGTMALADLTASQPVSGAISASANGVIETFFPSQPLSPTHTYQVSVTTDVTNGFGQNLTQAFASTFQTTSTGTLTLVSVNNSTAAIGAIVPILVQTLSLSSTPVAQIPVTFQVVSGNGVFQPSGLQTQTVISNATGYAQVSYQTSTQVNQDSVTISAVGFSSTAPFIVTTVLNPPANLRIYSGTNQIGAAGEAIPMPLIVQATDSGGNAVAGTTVTFSVTQGSGTFGGSPTGTAITNSSGTASISFTLGPSSGAVLVSAMFPGIGGQPPVFALQDLIPQVSSPTTVVGHVVDAQTLEPLENVYVYLVDNPSIWDWTDSSGFFTLTVSSGSHVLEVDGYQSGLIGNQLYPVVSLPVNAVLGQANNTGLSLLPELEQTSYIDVSDVQGGTLTLTSNPLWQLYVAPGQVTFSSGTHTGRLYAASVPSDRIPMPVAGGKTGLFFDTIQPLSVTFNPPAQVSFPNADNIPPGTITDIFTLSYSSGMFVKTGRGQVSPDGTIITSLPGEGITQGGWHHCPNQVPPATTCLTGRVATNYGVGLPGCTVTSNGYSTNTDNNGNYKFCNLPTGQPFYPVISCNKDSDGDGLSDGREIQLGTDPFNPDTDGDGFSDGTEVAAGTNPLDPTSFPTLLVSIPVCSNFTAGDYSFGYEIYPDVNFMASSAQIVVTNSSGTQVYTAATSAAGGADQGTWPSSSIISLPEGTYNIVVQVSFGSQMATSNTCSITKGSFLALKLNTNQYPNILYANGASQTTIQIKALSSDNITPIQGATVTLTAVNQYANPSGAIVSPVITDSNGLASSIYTASSLPVMTNETITVAGSAAGTQSATLALPIYNFSNYHFQQLSQDATSYNDASFIDELWSYSGSTGAAGVQAFLNDQSGDLKNESFGDPAISAAYLIWNAAESYYLNPKIILATLQKEQTLITGSATPDALAWAMGCGDPSTFPLQLECGGNSFLESYLVSIPKIGFNYGPKYASYGVSNPLAGNLPPPLTQQVYFSVVDHSTQSQFIYSPEVITFSPGCSQGPYCGGVSNFVTAWEQFGF